MLSELHKDMIASQRDSCEPSSLYDHQRLMKAALLPLLPGLEYFDGAAPDTI